LAEDNIRTDITAPIKIRALKCHPAAGDERHFQSRVLQQLIGIGIKVWLHRGSDTVESQMVAAAFMPRCYALLKPARFIQILFETSNPVRICHLNRTKHDFMPTNLLIHNQRFMIKTRRRRKNRSHLDVLMISDTNLPFYASCLVVFCYNQPIDLAIRCRC